MLVSSTPLRIESNKTKPISTVSIGDRLFACDGVHSVSRVLRRFVNEKIVIIKTQRDTVWMTKDQEVLLCDRSIKRAGDLIPGDVLVMNVVRRDGSLLVLPVGWTSNWREDDGWLQRYKGLMVLAVTETWMTGFMYSVELEESDHFFGRRMCFKCQH